MVTVADCGAVRQQTPSKWSLARGIFLELCRIDGLEIWICLLNLIRTGYLRWVGSEFNMALPGNRMK